MKQRHFRLLALLLAAVLFCTALAGCGRKDDTSNALSLSEQLDLGSRYLTELDYENAVIAFTAAIELDPQNTEAYAALYAIYQAQGKTDEANAVWQQMKESGVSGTDMVDKVLDKAAIIHEAGGNGLSVDLAVAGKALEEGLYRDAQNAFEAALKKDPSNRDAYAGLYVCASLLNEDAGDVLDRAGKYGLGAEDLEDGVDHYAKLAGVKVTLPKPQENDSEKKDNGDKDGGDDGNSTVPADETSANPSAKPAVVRPAAAETPAATTAEPAATAPETTAPAVTEPVITEPVIMDSEAPPEEAPPEEVPPEEVPPEETLPVGTPLTTDSAKRPDLPWLATYKVDYTQFEVVSGPETPLPLPALPTIGEPVRSYTGPVLPGRSETTVENGMEVTRWYNADGVVYSMTGRETLGDGSVRTTYFTPQGAARYYEIRQKQTVGDPAVYEEFYRTRYTMDGRVLADTVIYAYTYDANGNVVRYTEYDADYNLIFTQTGLVYHSDSFLVDTDMPYGQGISEYVYHEDGSFTYTYSIYNSEANAYIPYSREVYSADGSTSQRYILNADGTVKSTEIWTYDRANGARTITYYDGEYAAGAVPRRVETQYTDQNGNYSYIEERDGAGAVTDIDVYVYNANEQRTMTIYYKNNRNGMEFDYVSQNLYDEDGFLTSTVTRGNGSNAYYASVSAYDRLGNRIAYTFYRPDGSVSRQEVYRYQGTKCLGHKSIDYYQDGGWGEWEYDADGIKISGVRYRADGTKSSESVTENGVEKETYYEEDGKTVSRYTESESYRENDTNYQHETLSIRYENGVRTEKTVNTYSGKYRTSTVTYGATDEIKLREAEYAVVEGADYSVQVKSIDYYENGNRKSYYEGVPYLYTNSSGGTSVSTNTILNVNYNEDGSEDYRYEYAYDENGNKTAQKRYENGVLSSSSKYQYNAVKDRTLTVESVSYNADGSEYSRYEYAYDENGNRTAEKYYRNGVLSSSSKYQYNAVKDSTLTVESIYYKEDGSETDRYEYAYDENGHKTAEKYYRNGVLYSSSKYQYNAEKGYSVLAERTSYYADGSYYVTAYDENGTYIASTEYNADGTVKTASQSLEEGLEVPASLAASEDVLPAAAEEASPAADAPDQDADSAIAPVSLMPEEQEPEEAAAPAAPEEAAPAADASEVPAAEENAAPEDAAQAEPDDEEAMETEPGTEDAAQAEPDAETAAEEEPDAEDAAEEEPDAEDAAEDSGADPVETGADAAEGGSPSGEAPAEPEPAAEDEAA